MDVVFFSLPPKLPAPLNHREKTSYSAFKVNSMKTICNRNLSSFPKGISLQSKPFPSRPNKLILEDFFYFLKIITSRAGGTCSSVFSMLMANCFSPNMVS